jgi:hypothetical protein
MEMQDVRRKFEAFLEKGRKVSRIASRAEPRYGSLPLIYGNNSPRLNVGR